MPFEFTAPFEEIWGDLLLAFGWLLTAMGVAALAACILCGCLEAVERCLAGRGQRERAAGPARQVVMLGPEQTGCAPPVRSLDDTPAADDEVQAALCGEAGRRVARAFAHHT